MAYKKKNLSCAKKSSNPAIRQEENTRHFCVVCCAAFTSKGDLHRHLSKTKHGKNFRNVIDCKVCDASLTSVKDLGQHLLGKCHKKKTRYIRLVVNKDCDSNLIIQEGDGLNSASSSLDLLKIIMNMTENKKFLAPNNLEKVKSDLASNTTTDVEPVVNNEETLEAENQTEPLHSACTSKPNSLSDSLPKDIEPLPNNEKLEGENQKSEQLVSNKSNPFSDLTPNIPINDYELVNEGEKLNGEAKKVELLSMNNNDASKSNSSRNVGGFLNNKEMLMGDMQKIKVPECNGSGNINKPMENNLNSNSRDKSNLSNKHEKQDNSKSSGPSEVTQMENSDKNDESQVLNDRDNEMKFGKSHDRGDEDELMDSGCNFEDSYDISSAKPYYCDPYVQDTMAKLQSRANPSMYTYSYNANFFPAFPNRYTNPYWNQQWSYYPSNYYYNSSSNDLASKGWESNKKSGPSYFDGFRKARESWVNSDQNHIPSHQTAPRQKVQEKESMSGHSAPNTNKSFPKRVSPSIQNKNFNRGTQNIPFSQRNLHQNPMPTNSYWASYNCQSKADHVQESKNCENSSFVCGKTDKKTHFNDNARKSDSIKNKKSISSLNKVSRSRECSSENAKQNKVLLGKKLSSGQLRQPQNIKKINSQSNLNAKTCSTNAAKESGTENAKSFEHLNKNILPSDISKEHDNTKDISISITEPQYSPASTNSISSGKDLSPRKATLTALQKQRLNARLQSLTKYGKMLTGNQLKRMFLQSSDSEDDIDKKKSSFPAKQGRFKRVLLVDTPVAKKVSVGDEKLQEWGKRVLENWPELKADQKAVVNKLINISCSDLEKVKLKDLIQQHSMTKSTFQQPVLYPRMANFYSSRDERECTLDKIASEVASGLPQEVLSLLYDSLSRETQKQSYTKIASKCASDRLSQQPKQPVIPVGFKKRISEGISSSPLYQEHIITANPNQSSSTDQLNNNNMTKKVQEHVKTTKSPSKSPASKKRTFQSDSDDPLKRQKVLQHIDEAIKEVITKSVCLEKSPVSTTCDDISTDIKIEAEVDGQADLQTVSNQETLDVSSLLNLFASGAVRVKNEFEDPVIDAIKNLDVTTMEQLSYGTNVRETVPDQSTVQLTTNNNCVPDSMVQSVAQDVPVCPEANHSADVGKDMPFASNNNCVPDSMVQSAVQDVPVCPEANHSADVGKDMLFASNDKAEFSEVQKSTSSIDSETSKHVEVSIQTVPNEESLNQTSENNIKASLQNDFSQKSVNIDDVSELRHLIEKLKAANKLSNCLIKELLVISNEEKSLSEKAKEAESHIQEYQNLVEKWKQTKTEIHCKEAVLRERRLVILRNVCGINTDVSTEATSLETQDIVSEISNGHNQASNTEIQLNGDKQMTEVNNPLPSINISGNDETHMAKESDVLTIEDSPHLSPVPAEVDEKVEEEIFILPSISKNIPVVDLLCSESSNSETERESIPHKTEPDKRTVKLTKFEAHESAVTCIEVRGGYLYTCSSGTKVKRFSLSIPNDVVEFNGHTRKVTALCTAKVAGNFICLYTACIDGYLRAFRAYDGLPLYQVDMNCSIFCMCQGWSKLFLGLRDGGVAICSAKDGKWMDTLKSSSSVSRVAIDTQGSLRLLCIATYDGVISIWDTSTKMLLRLLEGKVKPPCCVQIRENHIYVSSVEKVLLVQDISTGRLKMHYNWSSTATGLAVLENYVLSCSYDGLIRCYDKRNGLKLHCMYYGAGKETVICMHLYAGWVFTGNRKGVVEAFKFDPHVLYSCKYDKCIFNFGRKEDLLHHVCSEHISNITGKENDCMWRDCSSHRFPSDWQLEQKQRHVKFHVV